MERMRIGLFYFYVVKVASDPLWPLTSIPSVFHSCLPFCFISLFSLINLGLSYSYIFAKDYHLDGCRIYFICLWVTAKKWCFQSLPNICIFMSHKCYNFWMNIKVFFHYSFWEFTIFLVHQGLGQKLMCVQVTEIL